MDINGGWPNNENLIADGLTDHGGDIDTILKIMVGPITTS